MKIFGVLFSALLLFIACGKEKKNTDKTDFKQAFVAPEVPAMITSPEDRRTYLALHYFDRFDFKDSDTTAQHQSSIGEQGISNFIEILKHVSPQVRDSAVFLTFQKASISSKMYVYFWKTMNHYLNDPNSPVRNEDIYISVCQSIEKLPKVDEVVSSNADFNLKQALKNRTGTIATNFTFTMESGKKMQMKDLKGKYILLFFYEPDCPTCIKTKAFMRQSPFLHDLVQQSVLTILAFYPQDDKELWLKLLPECSPDWVNGYDQTGYFSQKQPYDLRAYPTFYLLNSDKVVLLKDVPIDVILEYIQKNG